MSTAVLAPDRSALVEQTGTRHNLMSAYTRLLGWPLIIKGSAVMLPAHLGIVGLSLRAGVGGEVNTVIERFGHHSPVISVPGTPTRWTFLTDDDDCTPGSIPFGVDLLAGRAHRIPLPPTDLDGDYVRWVNAPDPSRPIAGLSQVLAAVNQVVRPRRAR